MKLKFHTSSYNTPSQRLMLMLKAWISLTILSSLVLLFTHHDAGYTISSLFFHSEISFNPWSRLPYITETFFHNLFYIGSGPLALILVLLYFNVFLQILFVPLAIYLMIRFIAAWCRSRYWSLPVSVTLIFTWCSAGIFTTWVFSRMH